MTLFSFKMAKVVLDVPAKESKDYTNAICSCDVELDIIYL